MKPKAELLQKDESGTIIRYQTGLALAWTVKRIHKSFLCAVLYHLVLFDINREGIRSLHSFA